MRKHSSRTPGRAPWKGFPHSKGSWTAGFLNALQAIKILRLLLEKSSSRLAKAVARFCLWIYPSHQWKHSFSVTFCVLSFLQDSANKLSSRLCLSEWTWPQLEHAGYPPLAPPDPLANLLHPPVPHRTALYELNLPGSFPYPLVSSWVWLRKGSIVRSEGGKRKGVRYVLPDSLPATVPVGSGSIPTGYPLLQLNFQGSRSYSLFAHSGLRMMMTLNPEAFHQPLRVSLTLPSFVNSPFFSSITLPEGARRLQIYPTPSSACTIPSSQVPVSSYPSMVFLSVVVLYTFPHTDWVTLNQFPMENS